MHPQDCICDEASLEVLAAGKHSQCRPPEITRGLVAAGLHGAEQALDNVKLSNTDC